METERKRILKLVENGTITAEEAIVLLEALTKTNNSNDTTSQNAMIPQSTFADEQKDQSNQQDKTRSSGFEDIFGKSFNNREANKKMDEFMSDLKEDLSQFSSRVMGLMNTTFSKIKDFDLEFPFGEKVQFERTYTFDADQIKAIDLEISSGKVEVVKAENNQFTIEAHVKTLLQDKNEEQTKAHFEDQFVKLQDTKLNIVAPSKMSQVNVRLAVPEKQYDLFILKTLNGAISVHDLDAKLFKVKTYNGAVKIDHTQFQNADIETGNGSIEMRYVKGEDLEAETGNGRIYIDGELQEVEAESVNGAVVVTTHSQNARKIKARTVAGAVEIYVPKNVSLTGQVTSNFGKADVGLADVVVRSEEDQFLLKTLHFEKMLENTNILKLSGESRTGAIIVRYIAE